MLASELLGRPVATESGAAAGIVHDVRVLLDSGTLVVTALSVGPDSWRGRLAHAWGMAEGDRVTRPAPLRRLVSTRGVRRVEVDDVLDWDHDGVVMVRAPDPGGPP